MRMNLLDWLVLNVLLFSTAYLVFKMWRIGGGYLPFAFVAIVCVIYFIVRWRSK